MPRRTRVDAVPGRGGDCSKDPARRRTGFGERTAESVEIDLDRAMIGNESTRVLVHVDAPAARSPGRARRSKDVIDSAIRKHQTWIEATSVGVHGRSVRDIRMLGNLAEGVAKGSGQCVEAGISRPEIGIAGEEERRVAGQKRLHDELGARIPIFPLPPKWVPAKLKRRPLLRSSSSAHSTRRGIASHSERADLVGMAADAAHDVEAHHPQTGLGGGTRPSAPTSARQPATVSSLSRVPAGRPRS